jgi:hypothetical protein
MIHTRLSKFSGRSLAAAVVMATLAIGATQYAPSAEARGFRGGFHGGGRCCWGGALLGGAIIGGAIAGSYYYGYPGYGYPAPYYPPAYPPGYYPPAVYPSAPPTYIEQQPYYQSAPPQGYSGAPSSP